VEAMQLTTLTPELPQLLREMGIKYEPERLADSLGQRPGELNKRAFKVATSLGRFLTSVLADYASGQLYNNTEYRSKQFRDVLSDLGPSFIKVGQALSSRPDLLPKPYLEALSTLQDRLPSFPTPVAMALIEEELGAPIDSIYSSLTPEPVAAASLGQVYKGVLRSTGEAVAVKVQRPGIGEAIAVDMVLLRRLMGAVDRYVTILSQPLVPLVDEFAGRLFGELDYEQEGRNAEKFQKLYAHVPKVGVPKIKWEATSRLVLTMEWIDGVKLTDEPAMAAAGLNVVDFVTIGVECTLRQLLEQGFFHADPHPGNLLATKAGNLVYLDYGMMAECPSSARYAIISHVVHLINRDYLAMCMDYYTLEFMDPSVDTTPIAPALAEFFDDVLDNTSVARLNFKTLVDGLGGVLFQYPFKVPAYYALILRSLTVLEGLALSADPQYNLLGAAYPYMARRLLTDPAPQLRASFEDLVLQDGRLRWERLENLWSEGSKSQDFDPQQLWLLAEWVCSEGGRPVRKPLAMEIVRLIDAVAVHATREQLATRFGGNVDQINRLVPTNSQEQKSRERAFTLWSMLTTNASSTEPIPMPELRTGGGPFGLPGPVEMNAFVGQLRDGLSASGPRLRFLFERPGAQELLLDVQWGLVQRVTARGVKLFMAATGSAAEEQQQLQQQSRL
jgi:predicted unusual protein kinase regulating ubiquinone biosynthesis (AarF/ABC1/UbiB family)